MGEVVDAIATPFDVVDPYLAPVRDVIDVLRTPIPVVSDLSELGGAGEVSLLSLLETLSAATQKPQLELAYRVIGLIDGVTALVGGIAALKTQAGDAGIPLESLAQAGAVLRVDPSEVALYEKCTETVSTTKPATGTTAASTTKKSAPCPDTNFFATEKAKPAAGVAGQTTNGNRSGNRNVKQNMSRTTKSVTGSVPGFSLPFLEDPEQLMDLLTGEGEASYFRLDLGSLVAQVAYTKRFGPIMAGPVPIVPFVGGSISVEGRLAMGFDSQPQTLAVESLSNPGDVDGLIEAYGRFDGGDIITEGFYLDDLDADGVDVPEVKIVTTLEAGAGVSIGIVTAGLKGGITLTINLDINDPNDDGRLRTAEINTIFEGKPECVFDVSADLEAFISIFISIELLFTSLDYSFDLLRLGPYTLFEYGCPDLVPVLVVQDGNNLALTSGSRNGSRVTPAGDVSDDYEVRQFDTGGGAAGGGTTEYEVSAFGRVQRVVVTTPGTGYHVDIFESGIGTSTSKVSEFNPSSLPTFSADGGGAEDRISFLPGETYDDQRRLVATDFSTSVTSLTGGALNDTLVTGNGNDSGIDGGTGDDSIDTGLGDDVATGGGNNDVITGGAGRDDLSGGDGEDRVEGGPGADRASGGLGNDGLVGGPGRDVRAVLVLPEGSPETVVDDQVRLGFDSGDILVGGGGADSVDGGDGTDVVVGGDETTLTTPAIGTLMRTGQREVNLLIENEANPPTNPVQRNIDVDTAKVPSDEELDPLCNSGTLAPGSGNSDYVTGGPERDIVVGGEGPDRLDGGAGPDEICGRNGDDDASGDGGTEEDGDNADVIRGGHGSDRVEGGLGGDTVFGDDVSLFRGSGVAAARVLDGSLGGSADGAGADYLDGADGADVLSGGGGSDLVLGGLGNDVSSGEGRDTVGGDGTTPEVADRLLGCNLTTRVVDGKVDLNGDLLAGAGGDGIASDDGRFAGLRVDDGVVKTLGGTTNVDGLVGDVVIVGGLVDLDHNGTAGNGDTGMVPLASVLDTSGSNTAGDCILSGDGDDELRGGHGSDYLGAGEGTDFAVGGHAHDLVLGDGGVDVLLGGGHDDVLVGGLGDDHLQGEDGDDRLRGNEGEDDLIGGGDADGSTDGQDVLLGGRQRDVLAAENATLVSPGIVEVVTAEVPNERTEETEDTIPAVPWTSADEVPAAVRADAESELRTFESAVACGGDDSDRWVSILQSDGLAGTPEQSPGTPLAYDELYGGFDCDWAFGSEGDDVVRGGQDDDVVEGGPGADRANGDDGRDVVVGGSSLDHVDGGEVSVDRDGSGVPDGPDIINGDGGPDGLIGSDLIAGDNALPMRLTPVEGSDLAEYAVQLLDVPADSVPVTSTSGPDVITGGGASDQVFGQGGNDVITTGSAADYVEGNDGADHVRPGGGDDDVVGGSSAADGLPLGADGSRLKATLSDAPEAPFDQTASGVFDGDDDVDGGTGADVVLGDNGRVTHPDSTDAASRDIALTDEDSNFSSGDDTLAGGDEGDRVYGQDGDDRISAGAGDDYVEGNSGTDTAYGDGDADVVIGGSSVNPAGDRTLGTLRVVQIPDARDMLFGDDASGEEVGTDQLFGDNATVLQVASKTVVQLADVPVGAAAAAGTSGGDIINGGSGADGTSGASDRVFGQGGDDTVTTGSAADYVEGNDGNDTISSGGGSDDVLGGSSATNGQAYGGTGGRLVAEIAGRTDATAAGVLDGVDTVRAGAGDDTVLGDNGRITRPAAGPSPDVAMADVTAGATSGSDLLYGEDGHDVLYGELDDGAAVAWAAGDRLDGGAGNDALLGDLAVVVRTPASELSAPRTLAINSEAVSEQVYGTGSVVPRTWVPEGLATTGGPDRAVGGTGDDVLHLGGGARHRQRRCRSRHGLRWRRRRRTVGRPQPRPAVRWPRRRHARREEAER